MSDRPMMPIDADTPYESGGAPECPECGDPQPHTHTRQPSTRTAEPRTPGAVAFMEAVRAAALDPAVAKMIGAEGEVLVALVSPDAIRDALIEAEAAAPAGLDVERLRAFAEKVAENEKEPDGTRAAARYALTGSLEPIVDAMRFAAAPAGSLDVALHDYLHNEGVWSAQREDDEDEDWHWRVCEGAARLLRDNPA